MLRNIYIIGLLCIVALLLPLFLSPFLLTIAILVLISMGLATSLNLIVGFAGQISFAHAAFYGIGAYSSALVALHFGFGFWGSFLYAVLFTALIGLLLGLPCLRLKGHYLAIATIGFQEIVMIVLLQWQGLTQGPAGIVGIPRPTVFGFSFNNLSMYYLGFIILALTLLMTIGMLRSSMGLQMIAVREDEVAAQATGVNTTKIKLIAFAVSSGMAGGLGSFYAHFIGSIDPYVFNIMLSATILVMLLGGGIGTIVGPLIGAFVLQIMPEVLRTFSDYRMVAYGLVLILIIMFMPQGVVGLLKDKWGTKSSSKRGEGIAS